VGHTNNGFSLSEVEHHYGDQVHLLADPFLATRLARLCSEEAGQPEVNAILRGLYRDLIRIVVAAELPRTRLRVRTRMAEVTEHAVLDVTGIDLGTEVVCVDIVRGGIVPSQVCYEVLTELLDPAGVRQDHLAMARATDAAGQVTGTDLHYAKVGGPIEGRYVLFPDPMGATGGSLSGAIDWYEDNVEGTPARWLALHLIVTPEYLRRLTTAHPDVHVYAMRLDRGLSPPDVLQTVPGARWDEECGLNEVQYIVPGAGGLGEVINNAFV